MSQSTRRSNLKTGCLVLAAIMGAGTLLVAFVAALWWNAMAYYRGRNIEYDGVLFHEVRGSLVACSIDPSSRGKKESVGIAIQVPSHREKPYLLHRLTEDEVAQFASLRWDTDQSVFRTYDANGGSFHFEKGQLYWVQLDKGEVLLAGSLDGRFFGFPAKMSDLYREFGKPRSIEFKRNILR